MSVSRGMLLQARQPPAAARPPRQRRRPTQPAAPCPSLAPCPTCAGPAACRPARCAQRGWGPTAAPPRCPAVSCKHGRLVCSSGLPSAAVPAAPAPSTLQHSLLCPPLHGHPAPSAHQPSLLRPPPAGHNGCLHCFAYLQQRSPSCPLCRSDFSPELQLVGVPPARGCSPLCALCVLQFNRPSIDLSTCHTLPPHARR